MQTSIWIGLASATAVAVAPPAWAYVRTTTKSGAALRWSGECIPLLVHAGQPPAPLSTDMVMNAAATAAVAWSRSAVGCTELMIAAGRSDAATGPASKDGTNAVILRRGKWCREPREPGEPCHDPTALAITTVTAQERDGIIVDADVEVNTVDFAWADLVTNPQPDCVPLASGSCDPPQDLQNTLTHELGHVIGLDHNCY